MAHMLGVESAKSRADRTRGWRPMALALTLAGQGLPATDKGLESLSGGRRSSHKLDIARVGRQLQNYPNFQVVGVFQLRFVQIEYLNPA